MEINLDNIGYIGFGIGERATGKGCVFCDLLSNQDNFLLTNSFNFSNPSPYNSLTSGVWRALRGRENEVEELMRIYSNHCIVSREFAEILFGKNAVKRMYKKLEAQNES